MRIIRSIIVAFLYLTSARTGVGHNNSIKPAITGGELAYYLSNPKTATVWKFNATDSVGYAMFVSYFIFEKDNALGAGTYDAWINTWTVPLLIEKYSGDDPDGDGIVNLMEYVIGGDPRICSTSHLSTQRKDESNLVLSYKRNDDSKNDTTSSANGVPT